MEKLIVELNKKLNNKFTFLKIYDVEYNVAEKLCTFTLMYPENVGDISFNDRNLIYDFIKSYLNLNGKLVLKFKKSYLDNEFILKEVMLFLKNNYSSIFAYIKDENIKIENKNCYINITLSFAKNIINCIDRAKFEIDIINYLSSKFCAEFSLEIKELPVLDYDGIIEKRLENVLEQNMVEKTPRYKVIDPVMLVGKEFYFEPEYIENIETEKPSVILAGKVANLNKKTFIKKGKVEKEKAYYTFLLNEGKSSISVVYFCPKANETKMDKLAVGDSVIMMGDVKNGYNGSLTLYARSIALCEIPKDIYITKPKTVVKNLGYKVVEPEKILSLEQENLFAVGPVYNKHIYDNNFVVFDVETTGLDADTCEIIEIGACKIENGKITQKFQTLVKPKRPISELITNLTGINNKMVFNAPIIEDVIKDFHYFCENTILVGYNVGFDIKFVQNAGKPEGCMFSNEIEDAMAIAREKLRLGNYKLKTVVKELNIKLDNAHRAYNDALATAKAFLKLNEIN